MTMLYTIIDRDACLAHSLEHLLKVIVDRFKLFDRSIRLSMCGGSATLPGSI